MSGLGVGRLNGGIVVFERIERRRGSEVVGEEQRAGLL